MEGFLVSDFADRFPEGLAQLAAWHREGKLKFREDVMEGIENMPKAFLRLLDGSNRSEEHTSELQSLMRISYAVFCLKKKKKISRNTLTKNETKDKIHIT